MPLFGGTSIAHARHVTVALIIRCCARPLDQSLKHATTLAILLRELTPLATTVGIRGALRGHAAGGKGEILAAAETDMSRPAVCIGFTPVDATADRNLDGYSILTRPKWLLRTIRIDLTLPG